MNYERRTQKKKRSTMTIKYIERKTEQNKSRVKTTSNYFIDTLWENKCKRNICPLEWDKSTNNCGDVWILFFTSIPIHRLSLWPWTNVFYFVWFLFAMAVSLVCSHSQCFICWAADSSHCAYWLWIVNTVATAMCLFYYNQSSVHIETNSKIFYM